MKITTKSIAFTALLTAVICVLSPITIPTGLVPLSLGTLAIYISCSVLDWKHGTAAVVAFIAIGMMGVPVFTGYANGWARIPGPTGGYIIGYIPMAVVIGIIIDKLEKHVWAYPVAMVAGTAVLYVFGTVWFIIWMHTTLGAALMSCVVPFLAFDAGKIIISSLVCYKLRFLIRKVVTGGKKKKKEKSEEASAQDNAEAPAENSSEIVSEGQAKGASVEVTATCAHTAENVADIQPEIDKNNEKGK